jgi:N-acetylmuramoyl-L-alanine amidase
MKGDLIKFCDYLRDSDLFRFDPNFPEMIKSEIDPYLKSLVEIPEGFMVFLSAGHGGLHPIDRQYQCLARGKKFYHKRGDFHADGWFYEGVWNRVLTARVIELFKQRGIPYIRVDNYMNSVWRDIPLKDRVNKANKYYEEYPKSIYISIHADAFNTKARGFTVHYQVGSVKGRRLAQLHRKNVKAGVLENGYDIRVRNIRANDLHETRMTAMPAILIEHLFFDNYEDAMLLMRDDVVNFFAEMILATILNYL